MACLDVEALGRNISANLQRAGDKKIRLATKSIRCTAVLRMILDQNPQFRGLMTYHGREAIELAEAGFTDLLMGYPIADEALLRDIGEAIGRGHSICLMVDSTDHLEMVERAGRATKTLIPVCLDLDMSARYPGLNFGVWRSGLRTESDLAALIDRLRQLEYVRLDGLMGYEAQIAGVGDAVRGDRLKNRLVRLLKRRSVVTVRERRRAAVEQLAAAGFPLRFVNGGGTGSLETTTREPAVTEVTVGSGFYQSHLFDNYRAFELEPALFYGVQIVRQPTPDVYTCHGGGFIASGGLDVLRAPKVYLPEGGQLDAMEGAGEVQTPVRFTDHHHQLAVGDPVFFRHAKSGELLERFNEVFLLENGQLRSAQTYRGQGWCFG